MKRRIGIEESDAESHCARRSRLHRIIDFFCGSPGQQEFYPRAMKRTYLHDGKTYKSMAFTNGVLFGGCMMQDCVHTCIPIEQFCPTDQTDAAQYMANLQVHNSAVSNNDVEVASEYRTLLESQRSDICVGCKERSRRVAQTDEASSASTHASPDLPDPAEQPTQAPTLSSSTPSTPTGVREAHPRPAKK